MPKVSIVIPTYKAEKYIERCARSLFGQTLDSIEYIFVDDCSPDNSITVMQKVLEEYPQRKELVKVIHHETNQGVGAARIHGIAACTGDYIIHCDPDDWVDLNMYESMYNKAIETDADMVYCNFCINNKKKESIVYFKDISCTEDFFLHMCSDQRYVSLCNKLYKASIIHQCSIDIYKHLTMNEDFVYNICYFDKTKNITSVKECYYHYFSNYKSISKSKWKRKHLNNVLLCYKLICDVVDCGKHKKICRTAYEQVILYLLLRHPEIIRDREFKIIKKRFFCSAFVTTPMKTDHKLALLLGMLYRKLPLLLLYMKQKLS